MNHHKLTGLTSHNKMHIQEAAPHHLHTQLEVLLLKNRRIQDISPINLQIREAEDRQLEVGEENHRRTGILSSSSTELDE